MTAPLPVSAFEANLLRLVRFILGDLPAEQASSIVHQRVTAPRGLSRNCVSLVQDTLKKGVIRFLVHSGGWRRDRFLHDGEPRAGWPWDRLPESKRRLAFSEHTLAFLVWLTAERPSDARQMWASPKSPPSLADHLVLLLACKRLQEFPEQWVALAHGTSVRANPFIWLAMPAQLAMDAVPNPPDFAPLFAPPGPAILECLQGWLAACWIEADAAKATLADWQGLEQRAKYEEAALVGFLAVAETANRRDLARFILQGISQRLRGEALELSQWTGGLAESRSLRLSERLAAKRSALSLLGALEVFDRWEREARSVGYFDDHYAAGQFWKADFESANGPELLAKYRAFTRELDPLASGKES